MSRVLLVTNDFPPRRGGIQSYLQEFVGHLVDAGTHTLTVYAPKWKGSDEFDKAAASGRKIVGYQQDPAHRPSGYRFSHCRHAANTPSRSVPRVSRTAVATSGWSYPHARR